MDSLRVYLPADDNAVWIVHHMCKWRRVLTRQASIDYGDTWLRGEASLYVYIYIGWYSVSGAMRVCDNVDV